MRKALIGILMGATMATPMAAHAQEVDGSNGAVPVRTQRAERQEQRVQRMEQRVERRQEAQEAQQVRAEQPRQQRVQEAAPVRTEARADGTGRNWPGRQDRAQRGAEQAVQQQQQQQQQQTFHRENRGTWGGRAAQDTSVRRDSGANWGMRTAPTNTVRRGTWGSRDQQTSNGTRDNRGSWSTNGRTDRYDRRGDNRNWSRDWRNDRRYDWQSWRGSNRSLFNIGRYYAPYRNYNYSRFSIGFQLGSAFYSDRYWLSDPWQYRLPPAYAGTQWVRYYDDVLLVDLYTGEVIDVIYDFFW